MSEEHLPNIPLFLSDAQNLEQETLSNKFTKLNQAEIERINHYNESSSPFSAKTAISKISMKFNRYSDIIPFDRNRIKLHSKRSSNNTDYINASYIEAPNNVRRYIATQGPLNKTIEDFWLMIWERNTNVIVMLTKQIEDGKIKCETYWPESVGYYVIIKDIGLKITLESEILDQRIDCYIRTLKLEKIGGLNTEYRQITQLQSLAWPDHGLPNSPEPIINLIMKKNEYIQYYTCLNNGNIGPTVIHCSAGCGRTGTFCTVDSTLALLPDLQQSDPTDLIFNVIQHLRQQRISMVESFAQFQFCYLAVLSKLVNDLHL